jgi:hypothetical protein
MSENRATSGGQKQKQMSKNSGTPSVHPAIKPYDVTKKEKAELADFALIRAPFTP